MADNGVACSMSRFGDVLDNAAPKNVFAQPETERITGEVHRTRHEARADVLDRSERVYNVVRTRSAIGDASPVEFARKMGLASLRVHETRRRPEAPSASTECAAPICLARPAGLGRGRVSRAQVRIRFSMALTTTRFSEIAADLELARKQAPLVRHMAVQDIRMRYARTLLGPFWITVTLGLYIMALAFVFGGLFNTPLATMLPWITLGLITFSFIANIVMEASTVLINNKHLLLQTRMSFTVWILFVTLRNLLIGAHHLVVFMAVVIIFGLPVSATWLLVIPGLLLITAFAFGLALFSAILSTRFRDVPPLIVNLYTIGLLAVPVLWRPTDLQRYRGIAEYNPVTYVMAVVREPLLGQTPALMTYAIAAASAAAALALGFLALARTRRRIMLWL